MTIANPLPVPYLHQQDMASDGWRKCFTTTAAMIAEYLGAEPRGVAGERAYDTVRANYGDTTTSQAQLAALRHLGLNAHYETSGDKARIIELIDKGIPVGIGMLHHGVNGCPPEATGFWLIGHTPTIASSTIPFGDLDLVSGTLGAYRALAAKRCITAGLTCCPVGMPGGSGGWLLCATK